MTVNGLLSGPRRPERLTSPAAVLAAGGVVRPPALPRMPAARRPARPGVASQ